MASLMMSIGRTVGRVEVKLWCGCRYVSKGKMWASNLDPGI